MAIDRGTKTGEPDIEELLDELAGKIERLRALYEQYFMGMEKMEPSTARKEVTRKLLDLQQNPIRNTAFRYRFNMLNQKFSVYQTYWNRTVREIEKGTYYRDVARVGRLAAAKGEEVPEEVIRSLPERLRARVMKDRDALRAKRKRESLAPPETGDEVEAPTAHEPAVAQIGKKTATSWLDADENDIDAALDNLFSEASSALDKLDKPRTAPTKVVPAPPPTRPVAATGSSPPPPRASVPPPLPRPGPPPVPGRATTPVPGTAPTPVPGPPSPPTPVPTGVTPTPIPGATPTPRPGMPTPRPGAMPTPRPGAIPTPRPGTGATPRPPGDLPPGIDERVARELHQRFVSAKRSLGEATDHIKYEHIVATIKKQAPAIMAQHKAAGVDFQVVVKDGKAILKATPKK